MKRIAIVISSQSGQTQKIADRISTQLKHGNCLVDVLTVEFDQVVSEARLKQYDAVILGCPVYLGDFPQMLLDWAWEHRDTLNTVPTGLFTESLNAADPRPRARVVDDKVLRTFIDQTDLRPRFVACFAGALEYTQYSFFKKCVLQGMSAAAGGPTDTSRDFELTDWSDVAGFTQAFKDQDTRSGFAAINRLPVVSDHVWSLTFPSVA